ncbi:MAG: hypothetical protein COA39_009890 [Sulfurimonas sp.]|nr:hypothetical protein [Sulfurimonas sp.]
MTKKNLLLITTVTVLINLSGCAGASIMDTKVSTKKARVIFEVSKDAEIDKVTKALYEAVSYRVSDLNENEGLLPEELPLKAKAPKQSQAFGRLAALAGNSPSFQMMQLDTSNAYYTVSGKGSMASEFSTKAEYYKAAIYPYKDGYKIYMYLFYQEGTDGIMGALTDMAVKSIVGKEGALLYAAQVRDKFKELLPEATIKSQSPRKLEKVVLNGIGWAKNTDSK